MTKVTLEDKYQKITIEVVNEDMCMEQMIDHIIVPMLRGAGYADSSITSYIETQVC